MIILGTTITLRDINVSRTSWNYWKEGIVAHNWWNALIENVFIRGSKDGQTDAYLGTGIVFKSCVRTNVVCGEYKMLDIIFDLSKSASYNHGNEGILFLGITAANGNKGINIGENSLNVLVEGSTLDGFRDTIILESSTSTGFHIITGNWFIHEQNTKVTFGAHAILLRKIGSIVKGNILTGSNTTDHDTNGIVADADADKLVIAGNMIRFCASAIWINGTEKNSILGNSIEQPRNPNYDIMLSAGTRYTAIVGNIMEKGITDNGQNNEKAHNIVTG